MAAAILLDGCSGHDARVEKLFNGTKFPLYSNARCASLGNLFRPDRVLDVRAGIPILTGSYYANESFVRVTDPILLTINEVVLQACIQVELGEIKAAEYTQILRDNSARFIAILQARRAPVDPADFVAKAGGAVPGTPPLSVDDIKYLAAETYRELASKPGAEAVASQVAGDQQQLEKTSTVQSVAVLVALLNRAFERSAALEDGQSPPQQPNPPPLPRGIAGKPYAFTYVLFDHDKSVISDGDQLRLTNFVANNCCDNRLVVYGFADVTGPSDYNLALARIRAARIGALIVQIRPRATVEQTSYGETDVIGEHLQDNRIVYVFAYAKATAPTVVRSGN